MNYPILILKKGDQNIYALKKNFGIASVGGGKFYENTVIIDCEGNVFKTDQVKVAGRASLKYCLLYFQKMIKLDISFHDESEKMELIELKKVLKDKISRNPKKWLSMGVIDDILNHIDSKNSFEELILMFE